MKWDNSGNVPEKPINWAKKGGCHSCLSFALDGKMSVWYTSSEWKRGKLLLSFVSA